VNLPVAAERDQTLRLLASLQQATEDLLLMGLAAASDATREALSTSFQAASRMKLLRLGVTLRVTTEEIGRFAKNDPMFSRRRFAFFVSRAWMLCRGMRQALEANDESQWVRLLGQPASREVAAMDVVCLGVGKRVVPGAFAAFEFRLRAISGDLSGSGRPLPLIWSGVFPLKAGAEVPPEAFLHLPQPQGFKPSVFLPGSVVRVTRALVSDEGRMTLGKESKVETTREAFDGWEPLLTWDARAALDRVRHHRPGPFDLEVELQEEVVLRDVRVGPPQPHEREHQLRYPLETSLGPFQVIVGSGPDEAPLRERLEGWKDVQSGPIFGLMHYEMCRFILQPLTRFGGEAPELSQLAENTFDAATLVKALKFT
jgi:hypothetical protein